MQNSPQRKKARFSQHPQIFQYSSKSKKEPAIDGDDSMLLDLNEEEPTHQKNYHPINEDKNDAYANTSVSEDRNRYNNAFQKDDLDSNAERQLQIDQISSDLAEIQAFLQMESRPLQQIKLKQQFICTPSRDKNNQRFSISIKPQLRSGRQTMNIEQEIRLRSTAKQLSDDLSNNKKRMMGIPIVNQNVTITEQLTKQKQQKKSLQQRIQNQLKKNKRITMDVKQLMSIINQYNGSSDDDLKRFREERKNRITMDVFALSKLIENVQEENEDDKPLGKVNDNLGTGISMTPIRNQKSRKTIFSTFKQNPHKSQIKLLVNSYLTDVQKRLQQRQTKNKKLSQYINQVKSQIVKFDLKISDAKKRIQRYTIEKQQGERKIKLINDQIDKKKYMDDLRYIRNIEIEKMMKIVKYQVNQNGYYGHFIFDGIYMKIKSKSKTAPTELKLMISQVAKQKQKQFLISLQDSIKLLRKYQLSLHQSGLCPHFLQTVLKIMTGFRRLQKLDNDLYYLSLNFQLKQFQINSTMDKLSFQVCIGLERYLLVEVSIRDFLTDESSGKAIAVYDPRKPGYIDVEVVVKSSASVLFQTMKKLVKDNIL